MRHEPAGSPYTSGKCSAPLWPRRGGEPEVHILNTLQVNEARVHGMYHAKGLRCHEPCLEPFERVALHVWPSYLTAPLHRGTGQSSMPSTHALMIGVIHRPQLSRPSVLTGGSHVSSRRRMELCFDDHKAGTGMGSWVSSRRRSSSCFFC